MSKTVLLTGSRGVVGPSLRQALEEDGCQVVPVSRARASGLRWNMAHPWTPANIQADTMIHCAPIWLLPTHIEELAKCGIKRLIAFSSTSVLAKQSSGNAREQSLVRSLQLGEGGVHEHCSRLGIDFTIFRPSMIYGFGRDKNIYSIARFIHRWGFAALTARATGLRQPVHALDLVQATMRVLDEPASFGKILTLAGAERLGYREMVGRIFSALGKSEKIVSIPLPLYRLALRLAAITGGFEYTPEMANRMRQDLAYDNGEAAALFGYDPAPFLQQPDRDLPDLI